LVSFYDMFMYPLESMGIRKARKSLVSMVSGNVLEVGSGTGVNIGLYDFDKIDSLILSDRKLSKKLKKVSMDKVTLKQIDVTSLPFEDNTFDYVVHTLVFCSVNDVNKGLLELKRVLKPNGKLVFIEHIHPEGNILKKVFSFLNPAWRKIASGCNINRDYIGSLESNGFHVVSTSKFMKTVFVYGVAEL